jgi:hypothetical protein
LNSKFVTGQVFQLMRDADEDDEIDEDDFYQIYFYSFYHPHQFNHLHLRPKPL